MDKGDELIKVMHENCLDNLRYFYELDINFMLYYTESIYENLAILDKLQNVAGKYRRNDVKLQLVKTLEEQNNKFYPYLMR